MARKPKRSHRAYKEWTPSVKQDAVVAYIWTWLYCAYVKFPFVMCMRDMWVVQWYCIFEGLVEICLITKMMGVVCEVVAGFL